jgi:hypothetical protein
MLLLALDTKHLFSTVKMKKITLLAFALLMSVVGYSQYYSLDWDLGQNPGGLNNDAEFPRGGGLPADWTWIASGPISDWQEVPLPFKFTFDGTEYSRIKVGNGIVTFDLAASTFPGNTPSNLPHTDIPNTSIAIWGINVGSGDFLVSKTFGSAPNRQYWIQFNTAKAAGLNDGWAYWSIVLEEGTNNIYIVDQRNNCVQGQQLCTGKTAFTLGIQIDGSTAYEIAGSPAVANRSGNDATPADNVYYAFYPGVQPDDDVMVSDLALERDHVLANGAIDIKGTIRNIGAKELNSIDLVYKVDGGTEVVDQITGLSVASGASYNFSHKTPFTPASSGNYKIDLEAKLPNGNADADASNNTASVDIRVHDKIFVRKPLYEIFTSSTCGPCNPGNTNFHDVIGAVENECVYIKYQQSWPGTGDPYCTQESNTRRTYYGVNSIPRMEIDGGWDGNAGSFTSQMHTDAVAVPAFMDIKAELVRWGKHVEVSVDIEPVTDFPGNNLLHIAIMEATTFDNAKTNGEFEFKQVMKKMMTGGSGINLGSLKKDVKVDRDFTWDFKGDYTLPADGTQGNWINHNLTHSVEDFEELMVAVWVQNQDTKEVFQSTYAVRMNASVADLASESKFTVYPNPAENQANINFELTGASNVSVSVITTSGQEVQAVNAGMLNAGENNVNVDLSNLNAGVYYVQLKTDFGVFTKPVTVK